jgi:hypothetical protein
MKKIYSIIICLLFLLVISCGAESKSVDVCRCLTEPGNSEWNKENQDACREAISEEIGVENWEKVNMSENLEISEKFDALAKRCTDNGVSSETNTKAIEDSEPNSNNENAQLVTNIGTSNGFIWESIDLKAQVYSTLSFDDTIFRNIVYLMNGKTNSEDFSKMLEVSGPWSAEDANNALGSISSNNVNVSWTFSDDYSTLTNNKGAIYKRINMK